MILDNGKIKRLNGESYFSVITIYGPQSECQKSENTTIPTQEDRLFLSVKVLELL
jgi:hypothetical protein